MGHDHPIADRDFLRPAAAFLLVFLSAGCGDNSGVGKTYAVAGKVMLDNKPLVADSATVLFVPDAAKGNASPFEPAGNVDEEGNYTLLTKGKEGAPPGWYKVIVTALADSPQHPKGRSAITRSPGPWSRPATARPKPPSWRSRLSKTLPPAPTT